MKLKAKFLKWSAGVPVAILNSKTAEEIGVQPQGRICVKNLKNNKKVSAVVNLAKKIIKVNEIALSTELEQRLEVKKNSRIDVTLAKDPDSLEYIKKKLEKKRLNQIEMQEIIQEVVDNTLTGTEIALFISAMHKQALTLKETIYLIKSILKTGNKLDFKDKVVVDKHSIGGIPGNRTTPIVVSICAASGLLVPKNSSKAITSAAGTADVIETIAKIDFSLDEIKKILKKTNACMIWGGALGIVPADSKILQIEKQLTLDAEAQLLASIMSKKLASDSNYIVIDIPYGKTAKVNKKRAKSLKRKFERLGFFFHKKIKVILTDGSQPIGNGIGPELELADVISVLKQNKDYPLDLEKKSVMLAGSLLEMTGIVKEGEGKSMAKGILASGEAYKKFSQIINAQKGKIRPIKKAKYKKDILAKRTSMIISFDNKKINSLAKIAGCPMYKVAGLYLYKHKRDIVRKGEKIITIYADSKSRLKQAFEYYNKEKPIKLL